MSWLQIVLGIVVGAASLAVAQRYTGKTQASAPVDDGAAMPPEWRRTLVTYLFVLGITLVYVVLKLYTVDFPDAPMAMESAPDSSAAAGDAQTGAVKGSCAEPASGTASGTSPGPAPMAMESAPDSSAAAASDAQTGAVKGSCAEPASGTASGTSPGPAPILFRVFPQSTLGTNPSLELSLYGCHFAPGARVRFNQSERGPKFADSRLIALLPEPSDLVGVGTIVVDVVNPDGQVSNTRTVQVLRPRAPFGLFGHVFPITREVQLLLLVLCAGALGSYVHVLKSLGDFIGNRSLTASWFVWYLTRPVLGMVLAFIFYAVLRGGFLTGTPADVRVVNPFGAVAVAALVGMFADKASQKLAEIFDTLFQSDDARSGKLSAPVIDRLVPDTITTGSAEPGEMKIVGNRLGTVNRVRVHAREIAPHTVTEKELIVLLLPEDVAAAGDVTVTVFNTDNEAAMATLHVAAAATAPAVTT